MKFIRSILFLAFPLYLVSCKTQQRILPNYLQNVTDTTVNEMVQFPELRIQKNDLLSIQVYSASTKPETTDAPYNLPGGIVAQTSSGNQGTRGILVDAYGNIEYPRIGILHVEGLTKLQLADIIKTKINEKDSVLTDPAVIIRFQNLKFTMVGELKTQGTMSIPGERVTILEAVGLAGGLTDFGERKKIRILREVDGKRQMGIVDLSNGNLFESPYYNLMQNDVVIVDPIRRKALRTEQDMARRQITFGVTIISSILLLYNIFK